MSLDPCATRTTERGPPDRGKGTKGEERLAEPSPHPELDGAGGESGREQGPDRFGSHQVVCKMVLPVGRNREGEEEDLGEQAVEQEPQAGACRRGADPLPRREPTGSSGGEVDQGAFDPEGSPEHPRIASRPPREDGSGGRSPPSQELDVGRSSAGLQYRTEECPGVQDSCQQQEGANEAGEDEEGVGDLVEEHPCGKGTPAEPWSGGGSQDG